MTERGANKVLYKRKGKSYEEVYNFNIEGFLGGGLGGSKGGSSSVHLGGSDGQQNVVRSASMGVQYDVYKKFPMFGMNGIYDLGDLSMNLGIVRRRQNQIEILKRKIEGWKEDIKTFGRRTKRNKNKCITRDKYISDAILNIKKFTHEKECRLKLLKEISKHIDISKKGSLRKPAGKSTSYKFRIYFFGKRQIVYLGKEDMLRMGFENSKFDDFDEYLKDLGRRLFLQRLGREETNVRRAQRLLRKFRGKN